MEVFKTGVGSWIYQGPSIFHVGGVPLFSGFMYASIGSYIARSWRLFDFRFTHHPPLWSVYLLALAIYVYFFAHHSCPIFASCCLPPWRWCSAGHGFTIAFTTNFAACPCCSGCFWSRFSSGSENVGTVTKTWRYPHQATAWVSLGKLGSWFLLLLISYALVTIVNRLEETAPNAKPQPASA